MKDPQEEADFVYRCVTLLYAWVIDIFFRDVRARGAHNIPKTGPVILACAPHANQFLDPIILLKVDQPQIFIYIWKHQVCVFALY